MKFKKGFTLIEMLIVVVIIAGLAALVIPMIGEVREKAAIITTLNEMKEIKEATRDKFYPDLGLIPEDLGQDGLPGTDDEGPQYATRFLCLRDDSAGNAEYQEMFDFIEHLLGTSEAKRLIFWDKYNRKGWRGPYMEQDTTYYDDDDNERYPILADAWFNGSESKAEREKHYYRIVMDASQDKDTARIISFGTGGDDDGSFLNPTIGLPTTAADLKDPNYDTGDDIVMFIFGAQPVRRP